MSKELQDKSLGSGSAGDLLPVLEADRASETTLVDAPSLGARAARAILPAPIARRVLVNRSKAAAADISAKERRALAALTAVAAQPVAQLVKDLKADTENGLTSAEAAASLKANGPNVLSNSKPRSPLAIFLAALPNPFNILLAILAVIAISTGDKATFSILLAMVALSVGLRFWQELRSERQAASLKALIKSECDVLRDGGQRLSVQRAKLVPGDVVQLSVGSVIPADCVVLASHLLTVSQSSLTGESLPVEKRALPHGAPVASAFDAANLLFLGTYVATGSCTALVVATGDHVYVAAMAEATAQRKPQTAFERAIQKTCFLMLAFMFVMAPTVIVIQGIVQKDWKGAALFGLSVAVGLVPEMLPACLSANMARGAHIMARNRVIVRRLDSVSTLGAVTVLCSDKTGTLTQDSFHVHGAVDALGAECDRPLQLAALNASLQQGLVNHLDAAITRAAAERELAEVLPGAAKVGEVAFDFTRRRLTVVVEHPSTGRYAVTKGAAEEVLAVCTSARGADGADAALDLAAINERLQKLQRRGLRVLGVATRPIEKYANGELSAHDEHSMTFEGFIAFLDPPKHDAEAAIARLRELHVATKVLTGDNLSTAVQVCRQIGIVAADTEEDAVGISGQDYAKLDQQSRRAAVERLSVFAKLTPIQKLEVVATLKSLGHSVAFLGDGINDAPALKIADVGITVDSACDLAKDSADVIQVSKELRNVHEGVVVGRRCQANTKKYLRLCAMGNFSNSLSVLIASCWLPYAPMSPTQLLTQNLLYDISQGSIPFDNVDDEMLEHATTWSMKSLATFMVAFGPVSSIFDVCLFSVNWFLYDVRDPSDTVAVNRANTAWFVQGLVTQLLVYFFLRTPKVPFIQSRPSIVVASTLLVISAIGIAIPYTPLGAAESMVPVYAADYAWLALFTSTYCVLVTLVKLFWNRVMKLSWL